MPAFINKEEKEERGWFDPGCTLVYGAMSFRVQCEEDEYIQIYSQKTNLFFSKPRGSERIALRN